MLDDYIIPGKKPWIKKALGSAFHLIWSPSCMTDQERNRWDRQWLHLFLSLPFMGIFQQESPHTETSMSPVTWQEHCLALFQCHCFVKHLWGANKNFDIVKKQHTFFCALFFLRFSLSHCTSYSCWLLLLIMDKCIPINSEGSRQRPNEMIYFQDEWCFESWFSDLYIFHLVHCLIAWIWYDMFPVRLIGGTISRINWELFFFGAIWLCWVLPHI